MMAPMNAYLLYSLALALQISSPASHSLTVELIQDNVPQAEYRIQGDGTLFHVYERSASGSATTSGASTAAGTATGKSPAETPFADLERSTYFSYVFTAIPIAVIATPANASATVSTGTGSSVAAGQHGTGPPADQPIAFSLKSAVDQLRALATNPSQTLSVPDPVAGLTSFLQASKSSAGNGGARGAGNATPAAAAGGMSSTSGVGAGMSGSGGATTGSTTASAMNILLSVRNGVVYLSLPDQGLLLVIP